MFRLVGFEARNFRSLKHVSLGTYDKENPTPLPDVVLLYGLNDAGKSNILRAVECWFVLVRALLEPGKGLEREVWEAPTRELAVPEAPLLSTFAHGETSLSLSGDLDVWKPDPSQGRAFRVSLTVELISRDRPMFQPGRLEPSSATVRLKSATFRRYEPDGTLGTPSLLLSHLPDSDDESSDTDAEFERDEERGEVLRVLQTVLLRPWVRLGAYRRWHEESVQENRSSLDWRLPSDGRDLKTRLFRARNGTDRQQRALFDKKFRSLIEREPFNLKDPTTVQSEGGMYELYVTEQPIEERGSGPQQWALMAGMVSISGAGIAAVEEPEVNMAWEAQRRVCEHLLKCVYDAEAPWQVIVTSHSPLMFDLVSKKEGGDDRVEWYEIQKANDGPTTVKRHEGSDSYKKLRELLSIVEKEVRLPPPGSVLLYPHNFVQLGDDAIQSLQVNVGQLIEYVCRPDAFSIELFGPKGSDQYLGIASSEPSEDSDEDV